MSDEENLLSADERVPRATEPYFFQRPSVLWTGVSGVSDFVPPLQRGATPTCINRITRLALIVAVVLAIVFRSWWPIVVGGGLLLLSLVIASGLEAATRQRHNQGHQDEDDDISSGSNSGGGDDGGDGGGGSRADTSAHSAPSSFPEASIFLEPDFGFDGGQQSFASDDMTVSAPTPTSALSSQKQSPNTLNSHDFSAVLSEHRVDENTDPILPASASPSPVGSAGSDVSSTLSTSASAAGQNGGEGVTCPLGPFAQAMEQRYNELVEQEAKQCDEQECRLRALEQIDPYDPAATIPNPSRHNNWLDVDARYKKEPPYRHVRAQAVGYGDDAPASEVGKEQQEYLRKKEQACRDANPNVGRVSTMIGINPETASLDHMPSSYRRSSLHNDIDSIYARAQSKGTAVTSATGPCGAPGARPIYDPTERMLHEMYQDVGDTFWKTAFADRAPPSWINPNHPDTRRREEQAAIERQSWRGFSMRQGP